MTSETLPLLLFAPMLFYAGLSDLQRMRIPNGVSYAAIGLFVVTLPFLAPPEILWRIAAAALVFVVGFGLWALRMFGAGDVKLLSALLLLVPVADLHLFSQVFAVCMLLGLALVTSVRASGLLRQTGWVSMRAAGHFPMGISIAMAGIVLPVLS